MKDNPNIHTIIFPKQRVITQIMTNADFKIRELKMEIKTLAEAEQIKKIEHFISKDFANDWFFIYIYKHISKNINKDSRLELNKDNIFMNEESYLELTNLDKELINKIFDNRPEEVRKQVLESLQSLFYPKKIYKKSDLNEDSILIKYR